MLVSYPHMIDEYKKNYIEVIVGLNGYLLQVQILSKLLHPFDV